MKKKPIYCSTNSMKWNFSKELYDGEMDLLSNSYSIADMD